MLNKILIIGISILIFANVGYSQELTTNSANFDDPRSTFANTSLIGLKVSPEITVGYERFYYNISNDDLHNAFLNFVLPIKNIVSIGLKTQYFNSYLYQQGLYSMAISKTFFHDRVGIGADIGFLNISYDQSDFKLDDLNDPVFANKTSKTSADFKSKKRRGLSSPSVVAGYHYDLIKNMITMGRAIEIISQSIIRAERMGPCKLAIFSSEFLANLNSLSNQLINP